jgi:hypothetical protein
VSVQDRCTIYAKRTIGSKIVFTNTMVLLGDEALLEAHFGPFRYSANLDARQVHDLRRTYHRIRSSFSHTRWNS